MKLLALKFIRKYKKLYNLQHWEVSLEISKVLPTVFILDKKTNYSLLVINKKESQSPKEIEKIVIRELSKLKEIHG